MEKENIAPESSEKRCEVEEDTYSKKKRSSILKMPRSDDVNFLRSFRRVSFSSNFIKPFMTDDDKNTIWDTTIEENINNTESTHNSENTSSPKGCDLNTSLFFDEINEPEVGSVDMELTEYTAQTTKIFTMKSISKKKVSMSLSEKLIIEKENIPLSVKKTVSLGEREYIPVIIKESIPSTEKENAISTFRKPAVSFELASTSSTSNIKIMEEADVDEMELTCHSGEISPSTAGDMEMTRQNSALLSCTSGNMELTCRNDNIAIHVDEDMEIECPSSDSSPESASRMDFTCQKSSLPPDDDRDMELTCRGPGLLTSSLLDTTQMSSESPAVELSNARDMEFTCQNPVLLKSDAITRLFNESSIVDQSNARDMEFTCQNLVLLKSNTITRLSNESSVVNRSHARDMEFTCQNPVLLKTNTITRMPNESSVVDQSQAKDMEFTCQNPVLLKTNTITRMPNESSVVDQSHAKDMEFICQNPVLLKTNTFTRMPNESSLVDQSHAKDMEFTCQNPVLLKTNTFTRMPNESSLVDQSHAKDMEFTCQNPVLLKTNTITRMMPNESSVVDQSHAKDMEFTCQNPVLLKSNTITRMPNERSVVDQSHSKDMEFTCQNPVLRKTNTITRMPYGSSVVDQSHAKDMEFTRQNPVLLKSNTITRMPNERSVVDQSHSKDMEFTCQNPVLIKTNTITRMPNESSVVDQSHAKDMEFTCQNPVLLKSNTITRMPNESSVVDQSQAKDMEFTCQNPVLLKSNTITRMPNERSVVDQCHARDMEFTCQNPVLFKSNTISLVSADSPAVEKSYVRDMDFTCQNPVSLKSNKITLMSSESPAVEQSYVRDKEFTRQNPVLLKSDTITLMSNECSEVEQSNAGDMHLICQNPVLSKSNTTTRMSSGSPVVEQSNVRDMELTRRDPVLSQSNTVTQTSCESPTMKKNKDDSTRVDDHSRGPVEQNLSSGSLSFRNNCDEWNVKEYSTCADGTMQLINSANNIINARNSTCDEVSLGNVSKHQFNVTYHVRDDEETEQHDASRTETDGNEEMVDEKEPLDVFSKFRAEGGVDTETLDQESSIVLINYSSDNISLEGENSKSNLHVEDHSTEKKSQEKIDETSKEKIIESGELVWNAAEFLNRRQEHLKRLKEKYNDIKLMPTPPVNDRFECYRNRFNESYIKYVELDRRIKEKYAAFQQYRDRILEECQDSDISLEISENESIENAEESDCEELMVVPSLIQKIEEKAKMCDDCWKIVKLDNSLGVFTTLFGKLEFSTEYNNHNLINNLSTKSLLCDKAKPIAYFLQKELLRALTTESICNSIGRHYNILTLLDYIQMVMEKIKKYYKEISELERNYQFVLTYDFKATLVILDVDLVIKWVFSMDLSDLENITKNSISVTALIGKVNEKYLLDLIEECPKGIEFILNYFCKIQEYLQLLKKRKTFVKQKALQ